MLVGDVVPVCGIGRLNRIFWRNFSFVFVVDLSRSQTVPGSVLSLSSPFALGARTPMTSIKETPVAPHLFQTPSFDQEPFGTPVKQGSVCRYKEQSDLSPEQIAAEIRTRKEIRHRARDLEDLQDFRISQLKASLEKIKKLEQVKRYFVLTECDCLWCHTSPPCPAESHPPAVF